MAGRRGLELAGGGDVPVPDTVRDAVLIGASDLSPEGRAAAEVAAVAGEEFDLAVVADTSSSAGLAELLGRELVTEAASGRGAFRHALTREALYADVPWIERRRLHVALAEALENSGGASIEIAGHWLAARDETRARGWLVEAAEASRRVHAHRDVARALRQALELWPAAEAPDLRIEALESYAHSAELSGELTEAARGWREICAVRAEVDNRLACARAQRRLAAVHELRGDRGAAFAARNAAAEAFAAEDCPAEAAVERLALANYMRASANYSASIELAVTAASDAGRAGRLDLRLRASDSGAWRRPRAWTSSAVSPPCARGSPRRSSTISPRCRPSSTSASAWCSTTRATTPGRTRCSTARSRFARRATRARTWPASPAWPT